MFLVIIALLDTFAATGDEGENLGDISSSGSGDSSLLTRSSWTGRRMLKQNTDESSVFA